MNRFFPQKVSDDDAWFRVGSLDVTTTVLVTGMCALSFIVYAISPAILTWFVLWPDKVFSGQVWRIVTWPIPNQPSLWSLITLAIFYMFGRQLEPLLGRVRFAWLLGLLVVVPGIAALPLNLVVGGLRYVEIAVFLVFVMLYPMVKSFFEIPLWVFGAVFLAIEVLQLVGARAFEDLAFLAIVLGTALLCMGAFNLSEAYPWIPKIPLPQFITKDPYQKSNRERERKQRAQQRGATKPTGSTRPKAGRKGADGNVVPIRDTARPEPRLDRADQADMDALLDKISETGMASLNEHERRRLDELSRRLRGER